jgi:hypothetical protein
VITFPGALKLVMFLPGDTAKKHRSTMVTILTRYFAGDKSLIQEVEANAVSESPVCQLAREVVQPPAWKSLEEYPSLKRKHAEVEVYNMETERINNCLVIFRVLCTDAVIDETAKQVFKQAYLSSAAGDAGVKGPKDFIELTANVEEKDNIINEKERELAEAKKTISELTAKVQEMDDLIANQRTKNTEDVLKTKSKSNNIVLENLKKAFVICIKESLQPIEEDVLYDAFLKSIPLRDHVLNLEAMFSICNPGKLLTLYFIKQYQERKRRVCQENFGFCLEMIGGEYAVHRQRLMWKNVIPTYRVLPSGDPGTKRSGSPR